MPSIPFTTATATEVRVRFCPSPTGTPHVGLMRTALFNWAYARHTGGKLVLRIEDTDAARDSEESFEQILDGLNWLGITWDEGVNVGGPHEPYRQSQRYGIYRDVVAKLVEAGHAYESFSTPEEIDARNEAAGRPKQSGYDNFDRALTDAQKAAFRAEGRLPAIRLKVPDHDIAFDDLIRGEITFPAGSFSDFVIVRPNGHPLYTLVNPVDDAIMQITHVLRGEDILPSTARQIPLYLALIDLGITTFVPRFGHLPYVMGEGNKKLSKRDPESNLFHHRDRGFIPEGLDNYLALLGWGYSADRDVFSMAEMVERFDIKDVNPNPARFDLKKAEAINAAHIRELDVEDFALRSEPYLEKAGVFADPPSPAQLAVLNAAASLVQGRVQLLGEVAGMIGFLFTDAASLGYDDDALATLDDQSGAVLAAASTALAAVSSWDASGIEVVLREALVDGGLGLKPRVAFGPLRVAASGRRVSPPLFESLEILGRDETLARIARLRERFG
ncbi:glutamate--tRNA ligase [Gryllotalpicola sp.]|uniref:glutamate--tRNA ligase n=1 Tax=Gryllotalpicola sp. TaxID=1932787 RepID=UPI002631FEB0|nr:glutamate--tRNA ligase [Gryllotalpicola sp.]